MDIEDTFEPDYNEDLPTSALDTMGTDGDCLITQELNHCVPGVSRDGDNGCSKISEVGPIDISDTQDGETFVIVECIDDELEGVGIISDDSSDECQSATRDDCGTESHDLRNILEAKLKEAIIAKQWKVLVDVFGSCSDSNLKEFLCFMCADQLRSPAEFFGISKFFQTESTNVEAVALIGSKLLMNADLCSNYKGGIVILKILLDANVLFHTLDIKTFPIVDVVKAAIKTCIHEDELSTICDLIKKTKLFDYTQLHLKSDCNTSSFIKRMLTLGIFFHHTMQSLVPLPLLDFTEVHLELASACLDALSILYVAKSQGSYPKVDKFLETFKDTPDKVWLLFKIFITHKKITKFLTLMRFSCQHNLITWSSYNYGMIISFFNSIKKSSIFEEASSFLVALNREGKETLPLFKKYSKDATFLKIYTCMTLDEIELYVSLFATSVKLHNKKKLKMVEWSIFLIHKSLTSMEFNHANGLLRKVLKTVNLRYTYLHKSYLVKQCFRKVPSLLTIRVPPQALIKPKHVGLGCNVLSNATKEGMTAGIISDDLLSLKTGIPKAILNHPRFAKMKQTRLDKIKIEEQATSVKASESFAGGSSGHSFGVDSGSDLDVYNRLRCDVESRLMFYTRNGDLSFAIAKCLFATLMDKLFKCLPRDANGNAIYDDVAFEESQKLINAHIKATLHQKP